MNYTPLIITKRFQGEFIMVDNKRSKKCAGNTLSIVLVVIIVFSILSIAIIFSLGYTTSYRRKEVNENIQTIILENRGYEVLNTFASQYDDSNALGQELEQFTTTYTVEAEYEISFLEITADTITFKLRFINEKDALQVTSKFNIDSDNKLINYTITKWGITLWN